MNNESFGTVDVGQLKDEQMRFSKIGLYAEETARAINKLIEAIEEKR